MLTILIVEDDSKLNQLYKIVLNKHNYHVLQAYNGVEACEIMDNNYIDLIITDIMMPQMDGYQFVKDIRQVNQTLPILMITAKDDFPSKSKGFNIGIDDYMTKPIDVNEMVLRVQALLRRAKNIYEKKQTLGQTVLDYDAFTVTFGGQTITLPQKEFLLLYKLASYPNKIFTRSQLMDEIWGVNSESDLQTIDVHINRLRRHFKDNKDFEIVTIRGLGYKVVLA